MHWISRFLPAHSASDRNRLRNQLRNQIWLSYALAPLCVSLALFLRLRLHNAHGPYLLMMLLPVLVVAYRGGLGPGIFCTVLSAAASAYFLLEPVHTFTIASRADQLDCLLLVVTGLLVTILAESAIRTQRRTEADFQDRMLMLDQTYGGLFVWEWDGPITFWNSTARKLYGYTEQEAVGRVSHDLLATSTANGMDNLLIDLEKNGVWQGDLSHQPRDGPRMTVKSRMLLVREPGRSFVVESNQDVTESRAAELGLARSQQRFETAFRLSPLGKLVVRLADDMIIEVNDSYARLMRAQRSEIAGRTLAGHNPLLDMRILAEIRHSLEDGQAVTGIHVRFQRQNGEIGIGVLYAEEIQGAPDRHALLVLHDVTERQLAEDKLRLANYDLQQFAYAAAHDLQEPTRNIATALGLFHRTYRATLNADGLELIQDSINAAKRMAQMIRDLLTFSHADRGAALHEACADANEILHQALRHLKIQIEESDAEIIASDLPVLQVQPTHLLQLLQNMIGNALKYRAENVPLRIFVHAQLDGAKWTLSVADNGIGFDPAFSEQIFGVFKRLHHSPEYSGNGIGLAICERIVRLYGGKIWAESAPGRGSTFFLTLPVAEVAAPSAMRTAG